MDENAASIDEKETIEKEKEKTLSPAGRSNSGEFDPLGLFNNEPGQAIFQLDETIQGGIDFKQVVAQYVALLKWISTVRSNGDWFQRVYPYEPHVQLQIQLRG